MSKQAKGSTQQSQTTIESFFLWEEGKDVC